jgi:phosphoribosyl-ATP pyrophosphohydrolase
MRSRKAWTLQWSRPSAELGSAERAGALRFGALSDTTLAAVTIQKSFDSLFAELTAKVADHDPRSTTVARVEAGVHEIGKKIVEEAAEVWMAAEYQSKDQAATEISQLLYHIQVLMLALDLGLEDIYERL